MQVAQSPVDQAANDFLTALQKTDPTVYRIVMQSVNNATIAANDTMGNAQAPAPSDGLWDSINTGIGSIWNYYTDKESAKQAAELAQQQAAAALAAQQQQIALAQQQAALAAAQAQSLEIRKQYELQAAQLAAQQAELQKEQDKLSGKNNMLLIAGVGVAAFLLLFAVRK